MMTIKNKNIFSGFVKLLDSNAPTLSTIGSVIGVGLTVYFMHKAAKNATKAQLEHEAKLENIGKAVEQEHITAEDARDEKGRENLSYALRLVYIYRWALLSGAASGGLAVLSNWLNGRTIAAVTGLLAMNTDKLQKGAEKVKEMVGEEKFQKFKEDLNKDIFVEKRDTGKLQTVVVKSAVEDGWETFYDTFWQRNIVVPRKQLEEQIKNANNIKVLDWNTWQNMLGLPSGRAGDGMLWDENNPFKARIGAWFPDENDGGGVNAIFYDNEPIRTTFTK